MTGSKRNLLLGFLLPLVALLILTAYRQYQVSYSHEVILPIVGYDPRDLLSGHYLQYEVKYETQKLCPDYHDENSRGFICLSHRTFSYEYPGGCDLILQGECTRGRFLAGIERFYIPEEHAVKLEKMIRDKPASIVIAVSGTGNAQVKDLLIDGKSWKTHLE